jgi:hypothetical protein
VVRGGLGRVREDWVSTDPLEMQRRPAQERQLSVLRRSERLVIVTPWCEERGDDAGINSSTCGGCGYVERFSA